MITGVFITEIIKDIESSYFGTHSPETAAKVIETIKEMNNNGYQESLAKLNQVMREAISGSDRLVEWNLYAIATRKIKSKIEYTFAEGQEVLFKNRTRTIKKVFNDQPYVELENGDLVAMELLKEKKPEQLSEQISLF